ncbi:hypothetical protein QF117_19935 [Vibrio sp. YMD68]|uniref:hypothetical protein n=1 Tax=Vibrio sp. YMD68 TaxID=3042300 RepID=UPI00249B617E|nr:hypothetical protein [Vibrio sp. YMD68]WGW00128.1 hypothetical protein QF117_19935 [Vibrio sp. YMD68]
MIQDRHPHSYHMVSDEPCEQEVAQPEQEVARIEQEVAQQTKPSCKLLIILKSNFGIRYALTRRQLSK